jgi:hypothetical protein
MTRRTFLDLLAKLAAVLGLQRVVSACGASPSEPGQDGPPQPDPVAAVIEGPITVALPEDGDPTARYVSRSTPREGILAERWERRRISPPVEEEHVSVGEGQQIEVSFTRDHAPAAYEMKLTVDAEGVDSDVATRRTAVFQPPPPSSSYQVPIAFYRYGPSGMALCFMSYFSLVETVIEGEPFSTNRLSWEPSGERLCVGIHGAGRRADIFTLDVQSETFTQIVDTSGIAWMPAWSPQGDWIAYIDDTRVPGNSADELCLVRPDGSELIHLSGDTPLDDYYGFYPSWSPDGTMLAVGNTRWTEGGAMVKRLAIYNSLWSGNPTRERVHTEDEIARALPGVDRRYLIEGGNGVAWSPDGSLIAYAATWGFDEQSERRIVIASAHGYGILGVLDRSSAGGPRWSPDGRYLLYDAYVGPGFHIFRVNADGTGEIDLSEASGEAADDFSAAWYG